MPDTQNKPTWVGIHLFQLPSIERTAMAHEWLLENPPDVGQFKQQFPDAKSMRGVLPGDELEDCRPNS
jgi:hypothetical protein